jgi:hypothetical protein
MIDLHKYTASNHERHLITQRDLRRPYGATITFNVLHAFKVGELTDATILFDSGAIGELRPAHSHSWETGKKLSISIQGFPTASIAEIEGQRLAQALLILAISLNIGLKLEYRGHLPVVVYDRFQSTGDKVLAEGVTGWQASAALSELVKAFRCYPLEERFFLSMELYCAAQLEMNDRARFLTTVSALEPLAQQRAYGSDVKKIIDAAHAALEESAIEESVRKSLRNRISELQRESVGQALHRLSDAYFPENAGIRKKIQRAYSLRSQLIHEGKLSESDIELVDETKQISKLLRTIYQQLTDHRFRVPASP